MSDTNPGEAGWQPDPSGTHDHRYWDGSQWTDNVSDAGVASTDPYVAAAEPPAAAAEPGPTDPTVSEPVVAAPPTDPTSAFSTGGPPPPIAAAPLAADGDGGGGGSKKGLLIGGGILVVVAIIVALLALGGGDDDNDELHADLVTAITRSTGISESDADCVADYLIDNVDEDTLEGLDFDSNDQPDAISDDLQDAGEECGLTGDDSTTTTESTDDTSGSTGTDVQIPDALLDQMVQQLVAGGLTQDQAECVAGNVVDSIQSGDLQPEELFSRYQEFFEGCDVDLEDIGN